MAAAFGRLQRGFLPLGGALCSGVQCRPKRWAKGLSDQFLGLLPGCSNVLSLSVNGFELALESFLKVQYAWWEIQINTSSMQASKQVVELKVETELIR